MPSVGAQSGASCLEGCLRVTELPSRAGRDPITGFGSRGSVRAAGIRLLLPRNRIRRLLYKLMVRNAELNCKLLLDAGDIRQYSHTAKLLFLYSKDD